MRFQASGRIFCALAIAVAGATAALAQTPDVQTIVARMQSAEAKVEANSAAYTATREYRLTAGDSQKATSQVLADVNYVPPSQKDYTIRKTEGNDRGAGIIRKVLDHEAELTPHRDRVAITDTNYNFALLGTDRIGEHRCYLVQLTPKRESSDLLRGKAWIDADQYLIRRVQGQPAKAPSWWIKDLTVTIDYGQTEGVWTQLATRADANVRLAGQHVLTSRAIDIRTASYSAAAAQHRSEMRRTYSTAGVWVPR